MGPALLSDQDIEDLAAYFQAKTKKAGEAPEDVIEQASTL